MESPKLRSNKTLIKVQKKDKKELSTFAKQKKDQKQSQIKIY